MLEYIKIHPLLDPIVVISWWIFSIMAGDWNH